MTYDTLVRASRESIRDALARLGCPEVPFAVEPAREGFGDISSNVAFLAARHMHASPADAARAISDECDAGDFMEHIRAHPSGYVNIDADWSALAGSILRRCAAGYDDVEDTGVAINIEHTSVNPNKALHIGHIRNVVIGDVVGRILKKIGNRVRILNYIDDSGLQVAEVVLGFVRLGFDAEPPAGQKFDSYCGDTVYVESARQCRDDESLQRLRQTILQRMEMPDTDEARMARMITRRVLASQLQTCWDLGAYYDVLNYESHILGSGLWHETFEKLKKMGLARLESDGPNAGCWVINDKVIVRSNGTATYMAKDIPYAAWKLGAVRDPFLYVEYMGQPRKTLLQSSLDGGEVRSFGASRVITVIDSRQSDLQGTISGIMGMMAPASEYVHLGYEAVTLSPGTVRMLGIDTTKKTQMSGRRGIYVAADAVFDAVRRRAASESVKRNPGMSQDMIYDISRMVASATIRYEMIRQDLGRPIVFDLERSMRLEGDTAPYLLYSHARASRILERAGMSPDYDQNMAVLESGQERALLRLLGMYGMVLRDAAGNLSPKVVARHCYRTAVAFNAFYESSRVVGGRHQNARLCLVDAFRRVMYDMLQTLGIETPPRM